MTKLRSNKRCGFNLIESAIVLGVVGLVVAGIWVAAAALSERREINNIKDLISYSQGLALRYSQGYAMDSSGTDLSLKRLIPDDQGLPGGFRRYFYTSTSSNLASENRKVATIPFYNKTFSLNGYNLDGSYDINIYFVQDATKNPTGWTYAPRPGVCAGILSWWLSLATTKHIAVESSDMVTPVVEWDSTSGTAPPSLNICNTITYLYLNVVL